MDTIFGSVTINQKRIKIVKKELPFEFFSYLWR